MNTRVAPKPTALLMRGGETLAFHPVVRGQWKPIPIFKIPDGTEPQRTSA